ncbi:MAG: hypothetical protein ABIL58_00680 [Pseudomonadota bacterium]
MDGFKDLEEANKEYNKLCQEYNLLLGILKDVVKLIIGILKGKNFEI